MNTGFGNHGDDAKEDIRSRLDIAAVVARYVNLKPSGQNLKGLCPFHKEKTPSFTVNPAKGVFHCFGCGKGGDLFAFLMEVEGLSFAEVLRMTAEETGVKLTHAPAREPGSPAAGIRKMDALRIHETATRFYYEQMRHSKEAVDYLKRRGLTGETAREFRLGYAPSGWSNLVAHMATKGVGPEALVVVGLAVASSAGTQPYDRFRERIMFPICDTSGRPIGFGGRGMEADATPKYLNSPDTVLYRKSRVLYGLHVARSAIKDDGFVVLVEGYMDVLSLYQAGIRNAIAASGTALTEEHGQLLRRFTQKVVVVFDGDRAGVAAAGRAVAVLAPHGLETSVLMLPDGQDPDEFVRSHGGRAFIDLAVEAPGALRFLVDVGRAELDVTTPTGKSSAVERVLPLIRATADPIARAALVKELAEELDIQEALVHARVPQAGKRAVQQSDARPPGAAKQYLQSAEGVVLHLLVREPALLGISRGTLSRETFTDKFSGDLYSLIAETYQAQGVLDRVIEATDDEKEKTVLSLMLVKDVPEGDLQEGFSLLVKQLQRKSVKKRYHENKILLKSESNPTRKGRLLQEQKELGARIRELSRQM